MVHLRQQRAACQQDSHLFPCRRISRNAERKEKRHEAQTPHAAREIDARQIDAKN
jgi:hypothetical protein